MPADSLTAALIAGSGTGGAEGNPFLLQYQPELQLAQGMMGQGFSTAPASPAQALARALTGAIGAGIQHSTTSELAKVYANQAQKMAPLFKGTPLGKALASGDPSEYLPALQQVPKAMLINSQRYDLAPGQKSFTGTLPTAENTNARSPVGISNEDQRVAAARGDQPGAQDIGRQTVKETSTPSGVQFPSNQAGPQTAPGVPQVAPRGVLPASAVPQPVNTPQGPQTPAQMPEAIAKAEGTQKAAEGLYGKASEAAGSQIGEYITAGGKDARNRLNALNSIDDALQAGGSNIMTGPQAERVLRVKEFLDGMGIDTSWVKEGLPMTEVVGKMNAQLASASARAMTGRPTQFEFAAWMKNNPGLLTSKEGTHALIDILRQSSQQDIGLGNKAMNKANWENWGNVVDQYYKDNPLISPFTKKPMAQDITRAATTAQPPAVGFTKGGFRFKGGDPSQQASWEKL